MEKQLKKQGFALGRTVKGKLRPTSQPSERWALWQNMIAV